MLRVLTAGEEIAAISLDQMMKITSILSQTEMLVELCFKPSFIILNICLFVLKLDLHKEERYREILLTLNGHNSLG